MPLDEAGLPTAGGDGPSPAGVPGSLSRAEETSMVQSYVKDREIVGTEPVAASPAVASATVVTPTDRVRWGAIFAGLFAAMSALVVLSLLGLAIGLSSVDAGDRPANFGI